MADYFTNPNFGEQFEQKDYHKRPEVSPEVIKEGKEKFRANVLRMTLAAVKKHQESISYRGLLVASTVIAFNPRTEGRYDTRTEHNYKPWENEEHGWDKHCAETSAMVMAIVHGAEYIPGIVVVSSHQKIGDNPEDKNQGTVGIHPCRNCRQLFRELISQNIMSSETILRVVNDSSLVELDYNHEIEIVFKKGEEPIKKKFPRLKLTKEPTKQNIQSLPFEELTMGDFLAKYPNDGPPKPGKSIAPYKVVLPPEKNKR